MGSVSARKSSHEPPNRPLQVANDPQASGLDAVLGLKAMPPRTRKDVLLRTRLDRRLVSSKVPVLMIQAPMGHGKTVLLAQWRRSIVGSGGAAAWFTADENDDAQRLLHGIVLSFRGAVGCPEFGRSSTSSGRQRDWHLRSAAGVLAEWSAFRRPVALILDDFDRVRDPQARDVGKYLLANMPPNGRLLMGVRNVQDSGWLLELQAYDQLSIIRENELAFTFEESVAFLQQRVGADLSEDLAARIHDLTGGWPIGLELCASTALEAENPIEGLESLRHRWRKISGNLVEWVTAAWPAELKSFLVEISVLDHLSVELCTAVTGRSNSAELVQQLRAKSGLLIETEDCSWFRLHHLAVDHLREEALHLPEEDLRSMHRRAARWLMERNFWADAAAHALKAGETAMAFDAMEQSLRSLLSAGRFDLIDSWLRLLPAHEIARRQRLRLSAAIRLAIRGAPQYRELVADLERSGERRLQFAAAVVHALAASHADDPDTAIAVLSEWPDASVSDDQPMVRAYYNIRRWLDALDPVQASPAIPAISLEEIEAYPLSGSISLYREALALMRDARPREAFELLRPGLELLERSLGRRSPPAVLIAVTMASAAIDRDDVMPVRALLADRLDLIDPGLLPDGFAFGFRAAAAVACYDGQVDRAEDLLRVLLARARTRSWPRIQAYALAELIKLMLAQGDHEAVNELLSELLDVHQGVAARGSLNGTHIGSVLALSRARVALARRENGQAHRAAGEAVEQARSARDAYRELEALLVQCAAAELTGEVDHTQLARTARAAQSRGCQRLLREADPILASHLRHILDSQQVHSTSGSGIRPSTLCVAATLTAREAQVLTSVSKGKSNKEIASGLSIGEGTIKWHLKNLFLKFGATDRRDLVARARLLGLIEQ